MPDAPAEAASPAPSSKTGLLIAGLFVNALLVTAVLGVLLFRPAPSAAAPAPESEAAAAEGATPGRGPSVPLGEFVVHLRNPEADRYARMTFEVELGTEKDREVLTANMPIVRDLFIGYLTDRTLEDLRGSTGLGKTKQELLERLGAAMPKASFRALYITEFVVQ